MRLRVEMEEEEGVRAVRIASARCPATVGADHEYGRRLGEDRAVALRELRLRVAGETGVRLVHAARERPVAESAPHDGEEEQSDDRQERPEPPTASLRRSRSARGLRRGARSSLERDLALLAAAAIQPVGLRSLGHAGRYGSPRRGGSRRHAESLMPLAICATPIGNLDDVTLRVLDELRAADIVLCEDTRHTRVLLERHAITATLLSYHQHNEAARTPQVIDRLRGGERVALVSDAGLPGVNDPGARLIAAALAGGLEVTVLPGASAVETALVASGLAADRFQFVGYLPRRAAELRALATELQSWSGAVVAFESPRRLPASLRALAAELPDRPAAVCRELTKRYEEVAQGSLEELSARFADPPRGEITLVLGATATTPSAGDEAAASAAVAELVAAGAARRTAADVVSRLSGTSRNRLYRGSL